MASYANKAPGVYFEEFETGAKPIEGVSTSIAGFVGIAEKGDINKAKKLTSWSDFINSFGRYNEEEAPFLAPSVYGFFSNGGSCCYVVRVEEANNASYIGTDEGLGRKTGLQIFKEIDEISLVCIPGIAAQEVQTKIIEHCLNMEDRVCILDSEKEADREQVEAQKEGVIEDKGFASLYYPWIQVSVEKTGASGKTELEKKFMPPSGYMAGIYSRSDSERGVHKAPANEIVRGVYELEVQITKEEQGGLNKNNINCIRSFKGRGIRIWGARTTSSDILWRYINVRRLFLYIEESIDEGTQWVVFEPNSERLWARVRATVTNFLTNTWRQGALMGSKPEEAFYVKCDRTTMTQDDIDTGKLICEIGIAPVKPAEFVIFRITQWTEGVES